MLSQTHFWTCINRNVTDGHAKEGIYQTHKYHRKYGNILYMEILPFKD